MCFSCQKERKEFSMRPDFEREARFSHLTRRNITGCAECDADSCCSAAGWEDDMNTKWTLLLRETNAARANREQDRVTALSPGSWGIVTEFSGPRGSMCLCCFCEASLQAVERPGTWYAIRGNLVDRELTDTETDSRWGRDGKGRSTSRKERAQQYD